jgi:hypothetical protein
MNILTRLFGTRKPAVSQVTAYCPPPSYEETALREVSICESTDALLPYVGHYSGYVREAAIGKCVELRRPELLPIIATRLNDWVPEIRRAARNGVMTMLPFADSPHLLATLVTVSKLQHTGRTDHAEWMHFFHSQLIRILPLAELADAVNGDSIQAGRACFELLDKYALLEPARLVDLGLRNLRDIILAIRAVHLCRSLPQQEQQERFEFASHSHFGAVRTIALRKLLASEAEKKADWAIAALFDSQSSVRDVAITYLKAQRYDLRAFYREAIQASGTLSKRLQIALGVLPAVSDKDHAACDIALTRDISKRGGPAVRRAALGAWLRLDYSAKDEVALQALHDDASAVREFAFHLVRKHGAFIPFAIISEVFMQTGELERLLIYSRDRKWDWLETIVCLAHSTATGDPLTQLLRSELKRWLSSTGRVFYLPNLQQKDLLTSERAVMLTTSLLDGYPELEKELRLALSVLE